MITSTARLEEVLENFRSGQSNLMLGTQMLVKGHDFPGVTLVVVILADGLFRWPDFRATERAFQVLKQVSGRAGRGEKAGRVMIQTFNADHPVISALKGNISEDELLREDQELRKALSYPPYGRMARLRVESPDQAEARSRAQFLAQAVGDLFSPSELEILGPSEAFLERAKGIFRWDLLVKSKEIRPLQKVVFTAKELSNQRKWSLLVDVDPYGGG
ncbi:unnamed protein product [Sphagnum jensenii]|uniref:Helicase C-terminal domain-containing protein n=1 Tax=Sphagnum jensenii TaxID=128206 RepID=A0ABP0V5Z4_9BRYO